MCPSRADITAMRSARNTASRTSCVTKMTVLRDRWAGTGNRLAFDEDRALLHGQEPADQVKERALAAAAWTEQCNQLAVAHFE